MKFPIAVIAALTLGVGMLLPTVAGAHVTIQPNAVPADGFTRVNVRVPNEQDNASTTKVAVKFPSGIYFASYEAVPGWTAKVTKQKLAAPVKMGDDETSEEVTGATFTATGEGIEPGQFQDFGLSISTPKKAGTSLTFPAVQTYSNGDVERWIGAADAEQPAPQLELTAAVPEGSHAMAAISDEKSDDSSSSTVAWIALALGALALALGAAALARTRKRTA